MSKKIKCIVKRPDEQFGHMTWVSDSLENLQKTVGGLIETVRLDNGTMLIFNEEGAIRRLPYNFTLGRVWEINSNDSIMLRNPIFGTVIVCGTDGEDFSDIPIDTREWQSLLCEWGN